MKPVLIGKDVWRVEQVDPAHPSLVDRTGALRIATTDPKTMTIRISNAVLPPLLDKVLLHEITHAATVSYGLLRNMRSLSPSDLWVPIEELAVGIIENHSIEILASASESLGRPVCVRGHCFEYVS